jgi:protoporphyrinogen oxidase
VRNEPRIVIVGAGPTGTAAAWRLEELGHTNWQLIEGSDHPGGLASSVVDSQGFTWDLGGHVLFSHWKYFDRLMDEALGDAWIEHIREAWVWIRSRWVPYPFQNNIWRLPEKDLRICLDGLLEVHRRQPGEQQPPASFGDWLLQSFGRGLCETFKFPYNRKVWGYDPDTLGVGWMGERVATVDMSRVQRNLIERRDDVSWGPNATFRFPLKGGTGAIWRGLHRKLPRARMTFGRRVVGIKTRSHVLRLDDGTDIVYDHLISSMPLDVLLRTIDDRPDLAPYAERFVHTSTHIVGVGFEGQTPAQLDTKCWMYFPEPGTPFYRVTVFSNYSPNNVARPLEQWSLMAEVSETPMKPVGETVLNDVVEGFRTVGLIDRETRIASTWHKRLEHGYPTPWLDRDSVLDVVQPALAAASILSRGRFGAWKYEVSNQDQSAMQGVEAVDHILHGLAETTIRGKMGVEPPTARAARKQD